VSAGSVISLLVLSISRLNSIGYIQKVGTGVPLSVDSDPLERYIHSKDARDGVGIEKGLDAWRFGFCFGYLFVLGPFAHFVLELRRV
jgi:hypothetical protein